MSFWEFTVDASYFIAAVLFIIGLKRMGSPKTAKSGIKWAGIGMVLAVVATFFYPDLHNIGLIVTAIVIGGAAAWVSGKKVEMTDMPLVVSHMFVFYFGILADLTPPVALACFAAAPIAKESGLKISLTAVKIAAAGFVIPFMAVYPPALMLQDRNVKSVRYQRRH